MEKEEARETEKGEKEVRSVGKISGRGVKSLKPH